MTAQASDILYFDGDQHFLQCEPLEDYFAENPPRLVIESTCTACWRGYIATWIIKRSKLYLDKLQGFDGEALALKGQLFPGEEGLVFAQWFSGPLICVNGLEVEYVHMGYETTYEQYLVIDVDHGEVTGITDMPLDQYRERFRCR